MEMNTREYLTIKNGKIYVSLHEPFLENPRVSSFIPPKNQCFNVIMEKLFCYIKFFWKIDECYDSLRPKINILSS